MPPHTRLNRIAPAEQLELRILPTVKVNFNPNSGLLKITGDNADNDVEVEGQGIEGKVKVFVDNVSVGEFTNVVSIKTNLKGGDDELDLAAFQIDGNVTVKLGDGADELDLDASARTVTEGLFIRGFLKADLGNDVGDLADFDDTVVIGGDATITGVVDVDFDGDGTFGTIVELNDDITFFSNLRINFSGLGDVNGDNFELDFDNVNVAGTTTLDGSNNIERFQFTNCNFDGDFNVNMDDGNDVIDIDNGAVNENLFGSQANFRGGDDNDTLLKGVDNLFAQPELITGFETIV